MVRLIVVTFAFLGWAFYVMSGGSEFVPAKAHLADKATDPVSTTAAAQSDVRFVETPEVTRVALDLDSPVVVAREIGTQRDPLPQQAVVQQASLDNSDLSNSDQGESVLIIPSLVANATVEPGASEFLLETTAAIADEPTTPQQEVSFADLRLVTGNRVNVRGGPGTDFSIVSKLVRGDEVEVLEDNGDGWVRFRAVGSDKSGWLADFLLTGS